jgi:hypothetical protein
MKIKEIIENCFVNDVLITSYFWKNIFSGKKEIKKCVTLYGQEEVKAIIPLKKYAIEIHINDIEERC